jgi:hypothetical protein
MLYNNTNNKVLSYDQEKAYTKSGCVAKPKAHRRKNSCHFIYMLI